MSGIAKWPLQYSTLPKLSWISRIEVNLKSHYDCQSHFSSSSSRNTVLQFKFDIHCRFDSNFLWIHNSSSTDSFLIVQANIMISCRLTSMTFPIYWLIAKINRQLHQLNYFSAAINIVLFRIKTVTIYAVTISGYIVADLFVINRLIWIWCIWDRFL